MTGLIAALPKAELHVHIEGTLEPEMMFAMGERNRVALPFRTLDECRAAYQFTDLQSFLDIYYQGAAVLRTPQDFYDLMTAYLDRAAVDGVRRAEIFFDPQSHTTRGVGFGVFMDGFREAIADGERRHGLSADLVLCFLRHLPAEDAVATIREAEPHLDGVIAVGLDSSEVGYPPGPFAEAYEIARSLGLRAVPLSIVGESSMQTWTHSIGTVVLAAWASWLAMSSMFWALPRRRPKLWTALIAGSRCPNTQRSASRSRRRRAGWNARVVNTVKPMASQTGTRALTARPRRSAAPA